MQVGDTIRARFMTLPIEYPGSGANGEKRFPVRKGTVVYVHPKGRLIDRLEDEVYRLKGGASE